MGVPALELRHAGLTYGGSRVLDDVSFSVRRGEVFCIVGPSGAGKSTVLRAINLLAPIDKGAIFVFGQPVIDANHNGAPPALRVIPEEHRRRVGLVFQEFNLWEDRTVLANLTEGPRRAAGLPRSEAEDQARSLLHRFALSRLAQRLPHQISGGERQRVALLRALLMKPQILLLDEATSALDPENIAEMHDTINSLSQQGLTIVIVTHHLHFARRVCSGAVMMDHGAVVETGSAEQVLRNPIQERTKRFIETLESSL